MRSTLQGRVRAEFSNEELKVLLRASSPAMFRFADASKSQLFTLSLSHSSHDLADQLSSESFDGVLITADLKNRELQTAIEAARPATSLLLLSCSRESFRTELLPAAQNGIVEPTATASELLDIFKNARAGKFSAPSWFF